MREDVRVDNPVDAPVRPRRHVDAGPSNRPFAGVGSRGVVRRRVLGRSAQDSGPGRCSPTRLRVGQFTDTYGPGPNGVYFAVREIEEVLLDAGHEVHLVAPATPGAHPLRGRPGWTQSRTPSVRVPRVPSHVATGRRIGPLLDDLGTAGLDLIHVHGFGPVCAAGVWAARRYDVPLVLTWHTDFHAYARHYRAFGALGPVYAWGLRASTMRQRRRSRGVIGHRGTPADGMGVGLRSTIRMMLRAADVVLAPSTKAAEIVADMCPGAHVVVHPTGVDPLRHPDAPAADAPPRPLPAGTPPTVLYVGRVVPEKGVALLLDAFELVRAQLPQARLVLVGDTDCAGPLRRRMKGLGPDDGIDVIGTVERERLAAYYAAADVFVFPSGTDTQGLVLHEAAHAGLPIVSVDPRLDTVVRHGVNADVCAPTPGDLAATLRRALADARDPVVGVAKAQASRRLADAYTRTRQSDQLLALYAALARRS